MGELTVSKQRKRIMRASPDDLELIGDLDDVDIKLRRYWLVVRKYLWVILGLASLVAILASLFVSTMRPVYRSSASLLVEGQSTNAMTLEEIYRAEHYQSEYFQTQVEILKSRDLARKVLDKLKLGEKPEFLGYPEDKPMLPWREWLHWLPALEISGPPANDAKPAAQPADPQESLIGAFLGRLKVVARRGTQLIDISFESNDPQLAKAIVDTLGETFIANSVDTRVSTTRQGSEWLGERLQALRDKLAASERKLQDFLEKEHLVDLEGVMTLTSKEVDSNSQRLAEARSRRSAIENLYNKIRSLGDNLYKNIEVVPEIHQDAGVQSLKGKEAEILGKLSDLGQRYGPDHPSMVSARSELESVNALLRRQIATIVNGIKNRYDVARADEQAALNNLETNKGQVQAIGRKQGMVRDLQQQVESNKKLYESFFDRYKESSETADIKTSNIRFIDHASYSASPVKPKKSQIVGISFAVTAFIGILLAFLLEQLDSTLKTPDDVESKLGVAVLGVIPLYKKSKHGQGKAEDISTLIMLKPKSGFAEAIRTVRTGLVLSALGNQHNAWLVTSSVPSEGKTTLAMNIGLAMAQLETGGVLLIDADLRRASLAKRFGLPPRNTLGLCHFLARDAELEACIHTVPNSSLHLMPVGLIPTNPSELLSSQRFAQLLDDLQTRYSVILLDSPPVHNVSDACLIAQHVQSVIYVVQADKTPVDVVKQGIKKLQHFGDNMVSVVLNQIDFDKPRQYGGYYKDYYYRNYYYAKDAYGSEEGAAADSGKPD